MRDPDVEALARRLRIAEASDLAFERGDLVRAFDLAIEGHDLVRIERLSRALGEVVDPGQRGSIANHARACAVRRGDEVAEGIVAAAVGALDDAAALFERAAESGRMAGAWKRAASIHGARGDLPRAARALERHLATDPGDAPARTTLAEALLEAGRAEAALRTLQAGGEGWEDAVSAPIRARVLGALGLAEPTRQRAPEELAAALGSPSSPTSATRDVRVPSHALLFGRYELVREVASTPSSRVLEARDRLEPTMPRVAVKIFTGVAHLGAGRDALARFRREMSILERLDAPGVVRPLALLDEGPTIVLPWLGGGSVADLVAQQGVTPRRAAEIVLRVMETLEAVHRRGIVHRDIKPSNVLLDDVGGVFLTDFGVAHLDDASATLTAGVLGTLRYMAPEQRRGEQTTPRSDLFAIGVLLAELLDGSDIPLAADALLRDLLAEDPARRPPDATAARQRLACIDWGPRAGDRRSPIHAPLAADDPSIRAPAPLVGRFVDLAGDGRSGTSAMSVMGERLRWDSFLDRREILVPASSGRESRAALARALARADDPTLPSVYGYDAASASFRVEEVEGRTVPLGELGEEEHAALTRGLSALMAAADNGLEDPAGMLEARAGSRHVRWAIRAVDRER